VSFSINTNIAALSAQNYLSADSKFQSATINEVTSGLRIVNSGDDAAGLAIANGLRNSAAVLTQGIQNANSGLATLQTVDGGVNNISQLLDRASTLATESSSSTFTGDRGVLNSEFQSVLSEVDRQAQAIGLNNGGTFAKDLSVFIGGGTAGSSSTVIQNGSINLNLSSSAVDTKSLGLTGYSATGSSAVDIGDGSKVVSGTSTSVSNIINNLANQNTQTKAGYTELYFTGPGFSDTGGSNRVGVSVNLSGVTDATTLTTAINSAIQAAGGGGSQQATAFKNAGITASLTTSSTTGTQLQFTSSTSAFQVEAGDSTANALLGNVTAANTPSGQSVATQVTGGTVNAAGAASAETVKLQITTGGTTSAVTVAIAGTETSNTNLLTDVQNGLAAAVTGGATALAGVTASLSGGKLVFSAGQGQSLQVQTSGDVNNYLGLGTFLTGAGNAASYSSITAGAADYTGATQDVQIGIGSQLVDLGNLAVGANETAAITTLNGALQGNALTRAANITAIDNGGNIELTSGNGTDFRLNVNGNVGGTGAGFGFNATTVAGVAATTSTATLTATANTNAGDLASPSIDANGTSTSGFLNFTGISVANASQNITLSSPDSNGVTHSIDISLTGGTNGTNGNANNVDAAISAINSALQQSNDSTLNQIVAVKDQSSTGADGIRLVSGLANFNLSVGTTPTGTGTLASNVAQGIYTPDSGGTNSVQGGSVIASKALGTASTVDISSLATAENAVTALTNAVSTLGKAQAAVGKGENLFNYAIQLAQSQVTNQVASESGIRDANMATEASNLSKAQILVQAGTAALAQANSAPQSILTLLRG
jgi:flagellin